MANYKKTYYTLRASKKPDGCLYPERVNPNKYESYEDAYDAMCKIYFAQTMMGSDRKEPERYGIWRTDVSEWDGKTNEITQPVWS